ncbi:MAG: hypothetical protein LBU94_04155 [Clostridiales bacterium]|jgi:hypothetical protein|nr:hypothetical protein [Clostridiales bacterium]
MEQILTIREITVKYFKKYEAFILPVLRFLVGYMVFSAINSIGFPLGVVDEIIGSYGFMYTLLMAVMFTVLPISLGYMLMAINIVLQFSANYEVAIVVSAALLLVILFYSRLSGREAWLLLFTILAFKYHIPYLIPLLAGLYFGVVSVVPIVLGVFFWEFTPFVLSAAAIETNKGLSLMDIPESLGQVFIFFAETVKDNSNWAVTAFVFALVIIVVNIVSKMSIDYSKEIAIAFGSVINIVCFIFLSAVTDFEVNILYLIFVTILSAGIMLVVKFFDIVLNYQRAERVEFEDDDNYYYVRVIPKLIVSRKERRLKKIRGTSRRSIEYDEFDDGLNDDEYYGEAYDDYDYDGRRESDRDDLVYNDGDYYEDDDNDLYDGE